MAESRTRRGPATASYTLAHTRTPSLPSVLPLTAFDTSATRAPIDAVEACRRTQASPCPACSSVKCLVDVLLLLLCLCLYRREVVLIFFSAPLSLHHYPLTCKHLEIHTRQHGKGRIRAQAAWLLPGVWHQCVDCRNWSGWSHRRH
jgi:hypothetical protein